MARGYLLGVLLVAQSGCALGALPGLGAGEVCRDVADATRERGRVCGVADLSDYEAWEAACSHAVTLHPIEESAELECLRAIGVQACDALNVRPAQCEGLFVEGL